eukprot:3817929-Amphidinium_carterae.2
MTIHVQSNNDSCAKHSRFKQACGKKQPLMQQAFETLSHCRLICNTPERQRGNLTSIGAWKTCATQLSIDGFRCKTGKHILGVVRVQDKASL